jgi:hypothetical protein
VLTTFLGLVPHLPAPPRGPPSQCPDSSRSPARPARAPGARSGEAGTLPSGVRDQTGTAAPGGGRDRAQVRRRGQGGRAAARAPAPSATKSRLTAWASVTALRIRGPRSGRGPAVPRPNLVRARSGTSETSRSVAKPRARLEGGDRHPQSVGKAVGVARSDRFGEAGTTPGGWRTWASPCLARHPRSPSGPLSEDLRCLWSTFPSGACNVTLSATPSAARCARS